MQGGNMKMPITLISFAVVLIMSGGATASESADVLGYKLNHEEVRSTALNQREQDSRNTGIKLDSPDLILHNIMNKVNANDPYMPNGQFNVELLVENIGDSTAGGQIDVYVLCGADSQHINMAHAFSPDTEFIEVGLFDLCDVCEDITIHGHVDLDPPNVDPTPENNVYEIHNIVPCLAEDTLRYDNGTMTGGIAYYTYQQGAAFNNLTPFLCGFQLGLTGVGNNGPLYVYVWQDTDRDTIPDEIIYTGHYFFADIPQWPDYGLYQGPLCIQTIPLTWYWIMVEQKHYADLGMLSYICIDESYNHPHSQWIYDPNTGTWTQGWGYDGDSWIRACISFW
jgi:hypothetical protein